MIDLYLFKSSSNYPSPTPQSIHISEPIQNMKNIKMSRIYQLFLINSLFKIFGNLKCFSIISILYESLKSMLCLRNTFLNFLEVDSTPEISYSEFYVFSKDGRAVSALRYYPSIFLLFLCLLVQEKEGVAILRFEISTIGRSRSGELAYR